jgi:hypothetical protein
MQAASLPSFLRQLRSITWGKEQTMIPSALVECTTWQTPQAKPTWGAGLPLAVLPPPAPVQVEGATSSCSTGVTAPELCALADADEGDQMLIVD